MNTIEIESVHEKLQRGLIIGAVVGSIGLSGQQLLDAASLEGWPILPILILSLGGWFWFGLSMLRIQRFGKTEAGKTFFHAVTGDEVVAAARGRAFVFGFTAMLLAQVPLLLLGNAFPETPILTMAVGASVTLTVGVCASTLRYLRLSRA